MSAETDDAKGRVKEAAGALSGDKDLKQEGKADQAGAKVKNFAENAKDKVEDAVDSLKEHMHRKD
ncbi:MAG: hypothetical protein JWM12_4006 [Ilumatobacteraceae bacterium]|nr:hypothetical protein [Ilumatobacteraceae bacterium]